MPGHHGIRFLTELLRSLFYRLRGLRGTVFLLSRLRLGSLFLLGRLRLGSLFLLSRLRLGSLFPLCWLRRGSLFLLGRLRRRRLFLLYRFRILSGSLRRGRFLGNHIVRICFRSRLLPVVLGFCDPLETAEERSKDQRDNKNE